MKYMEISISYFKEIMIELIIVFLIIFSIFYSNIAYSQQIIQDVVPVQGPAMFCGNKLDLKKTIDSYREQEFIILSGAMTENNSVYYILHRNPDTSSWSLIAYNITNAPKEIACLMGGGSKSFIAPDITSLNYMLQKQKEGYDKPFNPASEKTS